MALVIDGGGTITGLSAGGLPDASIVQADIASGAVGRSQLQYGNPQEIVVASGNLSGLSSFVFSITDYPSYMVYFDNIGSTTSGAHFQFKASYDGGSTYPTVWTYRESLNSVHGGASDGYNYNDSPSAAQAFIMTNLWNSTATGSGGHLKIQGCGVYAGTAKRLTFFGTAGTQSPSGQECRLFMGQTQDDSRQWNTVKMDLSAGTFLSNSRILVCGIRNV